MIQIGNLPGDSFLIERYISPSLEEDAALRRYCRICFSSVGINITQPDTDGAVQITFCAALGAHSRLQELCEYFNIKSPFSSEYIDDYRKNWLRLLDWKRESICGSEQGGLRARLPSVKHIQQEALSVLETMNIAHSRVDTKETDGQGAGIFDLVVSDEDAVRRLQQVLDTIPSDVISHWQPAPVWSIESLHPQCKMKQQPNRNLDAVLPVRLDDILALDHMSLVMWCQERSEKPGRYRQIKSILENLHLPYFLAPINMDSRKLLQVSFTQSAGTACRIHSFCQQVGIESLFSRDDLIQYSTERICLLDWRYAARDAAGNTCIQTTIRADLGLAKEFMLALRTLGVDSQIVILPSGDPSGESTHTSPVVCTIDDPPPKNMIITIHAPQSMARLAEIVPLQCENLYDALMDRRCCPTRKTASYVACSLGCRLAPR